VAGDGIRSARLLKYVRPTYPKEAKKAQVQGVVRVQALITKSGEVSEPQVLSGDPALVPAALAAVRQWRYAPTELRGEPVEVRTTIDVNFTLNQ
jgi:protein TonB